MKYVIKRWKLNSYPFNWWAVCDREGPIAYRETCQEALDYLLCTGRRFVEIIP